MSTDSFFEKIAYPSLTDSPAAESTDRASARGYAAGYAAGARAAATDAEQLVLQAREQQELFAVQARTSMASALAALNAASARANTLRQPTIAESDAALAAAALELAEAILGHELADGEASAKAAIARALAVAGNDEILVVRMNAEDLEVLETTPPALESVRLVADPELERGDAMIETAAGTIDARLKSSLDRARAILLGGAE